MDATGLWCPPSVSPLNWWSTLAGKLYGDGQPHPDLILIGIRGVLPWASETHDTVSKAAYDDCFVLLQPNKPPSIFAGSTHAYQLFSKLSPGGAVATIKPGKYLLTYTPDGKIPMFTLSLPDGGKDIPCFRDLKHDGRPCDEADTSDGYTADGILFHTGYDAPPEAHHRSSIGCQTASLEYLQLLEKAGHSIPYILTTAPYAIYAMHDVAAQYNASGVGV